MKVPMLTAKDRMLRNLKDQPHDSTYDDLLGEVAFARMVDRELKDSDAGRTISTTDLQRRVRAWRT